MEQYVVDNKIKCPKCGKNKGYIYGDDEIVFNDLGHGHYFADCNCRDCGHTFRQYYYFKYELTSSTPSKW